MLNLLGISVAHTVEYTRFTRFRYTLYKEVATANWLTFFQHLIRKFIADCKFSISFRHTLLYLSLDLSFYCLMQNQCIR